MLRLFWFLILFKIIKFIQSPALNDDDNWYPFMACWKRVTCFCDRNEKTHEPSFNEICSNFYYWLPILCWGELSNWINENKRLKINCLNKRPSPGFIRLPEVFRQGRQLEQLFLTDSPSKENSIWLNPNYFECFFSVFRHLQAWHTFHLFSEVPRKTQNFRLFFENRC